MLQIDLTFLAVFALVWILVIILNRFFFRPYLGIREKRQKILKENEEASMQAMREYEEHLREIEERLKEARQESSLLREKIISRTLEDKARLVSEIQSEVKQQVETARAELARQTEELKKELDREVERLARQVEERVLN